jgi:F-type H+-transporting ATPase subunit b
MPQFDFATFIPQIFWLLICFAALYLAASRVILPRIASILSQRESKIGLDLNSAESLQEEIDKVQAHCEELRNNSSKSYLQSIDDAVKKSAIAREKALNKAKEEIEETMTASEKEVANFVKKSKADYNIAAAGVVDVIVKKIFGQDAKLQKDVQVILNKYDS